MEVPPNEYRRRSWGPASAGINGRIRQSQRANPFTLPPDHALNEAIVTQQNNELFVRIAYEGFLESIGMNGPTKYIPKAYFSCRRDGHPNRLKVMRPRYDPLDPRLTDWILAEENVKDMPCKECMKKLPLIMCLEIDIHTMEIAGSVDSYCNNLECLTITHYLSGPFKHDRIYRGIFS